MSLIQVPVAVVVVEAVVVVVVAVAAAAAANGQTTTSAFYKVVYRQFWSEMATTKAICVKFFLMSHGKNY